MVRLESDINKCLAEAGLPAHGKDSPDAMGGPVEPMEQETTVGYIYMLKTAPSWLMTRCMHEAPGLTRSSRSNRLGGKARGSVVSDSERWKFGLWEAYGAAYILQELLTVKSDDVEGRTKIYESMVKVREHARSGNASQFRRFDQRDSRSCTQHAA